MIFSKSRLCQPEAFADTCESWRGPGVSGGCSEGCKFVVPSRPSPYLNNNKY